MQNTETFSNCAGNIVGQKKKKKAVPNTGTQKTERWPCTFPQRSTSQDLIIDLYKDNT